MSPKRQFHSPVMLRKASKQPSQAKPAQNSDTSEKVSKLALQLLANASAHISKERHKERRKNALKDLNKDLLTITEEDKRFANVTPMLFGDDFEKTMKEHMEAMRCIRKSSGAKMTESFFRKGHPPGQYHNSHHRRDGNSYRGHGQYQPYFRNHNGRKENFQRKKPQNQG